MSHTWFLWFQAGFSLLYGIIYTWSVHRFCIGPFVCVRRRKKPFLLLLPIIFTLLDICSLCGLLPAPAAHFIPFLWQALFILWVLLLYRAETARKLLAAVILLLVPMLLRRFADSLVSMLVLFICHVTHEAVSPVGEQFLFCVLCPTILLCPIMSISYLKKHMTGFFDNRLHRWYIMLTVPLFAIILLWNLISIGASYGILFRGGDYLNLYYNQLFSHVGICVLSFLCLCGAGFYLYGMDRIDIEQKKKEQYHSQVTFYQMLEEQYRNLERLRHDIKNHVIGLQRLIDCHEWDKLSPYLHKMADFGDIESGDELTGRHVVDALFYYKHRQAMQSFIRWECDAHFPPGCPIDDFDLCVIFGNLLDNALAACDKLPEGNDRSIQIHTRMIRNCLLVEIANSIQSAAGLKHVNRGIGLRNVEDVLDKYNGTLHIDTENDAFRVSLLVPCPPAAYDINRTV